MKEVSIIELDLATHVFQAHGLQLTGWWFSAASCHGPNY